MLELQVCAVMLGCSAEYPTQDLVPARQVLYLLRDINSPYFSLFETGLHCVAQESLKFFIFLPVPPEG